MSYTLALIGCGRVGVWLEDDPLRAKPASHMGGLSRVTDGKKVKRGLVLTSACDIDNMRLTNFGERFNIHSSHLYEDYRVLISEEKPDIIIIATWTASHRDIAVFAAENGVKGIVLEKPLASSLKDARDIVETCERFNVTLVVNHERRWDPRFIKTKEIVNSEILGKLKSIVANVFSQSAPVGAWEDVLDIAGGGPLLHDGTHLVDLIRYFAGDIHSVSGHVTRERPEFGTETTATAYLRSESGINIFLEAGGMREYFNFETDLQFECGRIRIGNGLCEYYVSGNSPRYTGFKDLSKTPFPEFSRNVEPFSGALLELIEAMETGNKPNSSGEDGLKVMEVIFGIYYSASLKGKTLVLPLKFSGHPLKKMFKGGML